MAIMKHEKMSPSEKRAKIEQCWSKQVVAEAEEFSFDIKAVVQPVLKDEAMRVLLHG